MAKDKPPPFEIPAEMRSIAEKSVEQARQAFEGLLDAAHRFVDTFGGQNETAGKGGKRVADRAMTFMQVGHQHDLAARQLERVMMHARLCFIDAPEPRHSGPELARRENAETGFAFDLALERELGSRL